MQGLKEREPPFFDGLVYEARVPLVWRYLELRPDEKQIVFANTANEQLLRLITSLSEKPQEAVDGEFHAELERIDLKITVLLDMASHIIRDQLNLPAPEPVRMDARGAEWTTANPPETKRLLNAKVYIDPELPRPLEFFGLCQVSELTDPAQRGARVRMRFIRVGQAVADELEKFIFRQHRKEIAMQRDALKGGSR